MKHRTRRDRKTLTSANQQRSYVLKASNGDAPLHDVLPDGRGAGESQLTDVRVVREPLAHQTAWIQGGVAGEGGRRRSRLGRGDGGQREAQSRLSLIGTDRSGTRLTRSRDDVDDSFRDARLHRQLSELQRSEGSDLDTHAHTHT